MHPSVEMMGAVELDARMHDVWREMFQDRTNGLRMKRTRSRRLGDKIWQRGASAPSLRGTGSDDPLPWYDVVRRERDGSTRLSSMIACVPL